MKLVKLLAVFAVVSVYLIHTADGIVLGESTPLTSALRDLRNNIASLTTEESKRSSAFRQKTDELLNCEECRIPNHKRTSGNRGGRPSRSEKSANVELVESLKTKGIIRSSRVESAMSQVDRGDFSDRNPYNDSPQNIGYGVTISAPYMHAHALEALEPKLKPGAKVLDIGSGSGYLTAAMSEMVGSTGKLIGIEHIRELTQIAIQNVRKHHAYMLDNGQLELKTGDGRKGYPPEAPYDAIHVGAAVANIPQPLIDQLKVGGRLVIPVGPIGANQMLEQCVRIRDRFALVLKDIDLDFALKVVRTRDIRAGQLIDKLPNGELRKQSLMLVRFVPLTSQSNQWPRNRG